MRSPKKPFYILLGIVFAYLSYTSYDKYNRAQQQIDFLQEAQQAATVDAARAALERGEPWLEKHLADSAQLRIWHSNIDYLKEQPELTLLDPIIKKSISKNAIAVKASFATGWLWLFPSGAFGGMSLFSVISLFPD